MADKAVITILGTIGKRTDPNKNLNKKIENVLNSANSDIEALNRIVSEEKKSLESLLKGVNEKIESVNISLNPNRESRYELPRDLSCFCRISQKIEKFFKSRCKTEEPEVAKLEEKTIESVEIDSLSSLFGEVEPLDIESYKLKEIEDYFPKALYKSQIEEIKETENINTLPILIDTFQENGYEIIALYTEDTNNTKGSKTIQEEVLKYLNIEYEFKPEWKIEDETDFDTLFSQIDSIINDYDEVILDVSHGFRHLPILAIVDAIIHNLKDTERIKKILFAKEIKRFQEYEFIDLKRYLDLANISYALNTFNRNYTVANNIKVSDENFANLLDSLSEFSKHILANSIYALLRDTDNEESIVTKLIAQINEILNSDDNIYHSIKRPLGSIDFHLKVIDSYRNKTNYKTTYLLAKEMHKKGYLLNSITLLNEAVGMLCMNEIKKLNSNIETVIDEYKRRAEEQQNNPRPTFQLYELYTQSKKFYQRGSDYRRNFRNDNICYLSVRGREYRDWNIRAKENEDDIKELINQNRDQYLIGVIRKIGDTRNNLAHANTSQRLGDVGKEIQELIERFEEIIQRLEGNS